MALLSHSPRWLRVAVWVFACVAYLSAIMSRTSLSATSAIASDRFSLTSDDLAAFGILQLLVYAAAQIPIGMLVDRLGGRTVLLGGLVIIAVSQVLIGFGEGFSALLVARALAGLGDAMVFPSAVRLIAVALPTRWTPLGTQSIGIVGNFGMVITATPLIMLIDVTSWPTGYAVMAAFTGVIALGAAVVLAMMGRDPSRTASGESFGSVMRGTVAAMRERGSWFAFSAHVITAAPFTAFVVTWGPLFLAHGAGLDSGQIGVYLLSIPLIGMVAGLAIGRAIVGRPRVRTAIIVAVALLQLVTWGLVLIWPTPTPAFALVFLAVALSVGGPASLTAFEISRDYVAPSLAARANGVVNTGGFSGALVTIWLTGAMLTAQGAETPDDYSMELFRIAYLPMLGMLVAGLIVFVLLARRIGPTRR
ncbi:MAG TPA: MFS transporter [Candidatus Microbacterium pullistercoris]|nr:MFS transporter [Candidatus Microbacterium pullistercoris]